MIELIKTIECYGIMCRYKYAKLAYLYTLNNDKESTLKYAFKAIENGHELSSFELPICKEIFSEIENEYDSISKMYNQRIDTTTRKIITNIVSLDQSVRNSRMFHVMQKVDSINYSMLDSITETSGWPSVSKIGHSYSDENSNSQLLVLNMNKEEKERYFNVYYNSCLKGEDNWILAPNIMCNIFYRHYFPLKKYSTKMIYFNEDGLQVRESLFMLESLCKCFTNNNGSYRLTVNTTQNNTSAIEESIIDYFIKCGAENIEVEVVFLDKVGGEDRVYIESK